MPGPTARPLSSLPRFARNLRIAQTASGLKNREVAQRLEVSESQWAKWKRGEIEPRFVTVIRIAEVFDRTADWFGEDNDEEAVAA